MVSSAAFFVVRVRVGVVGVTDASPFRNLAPVLCR